MLWECDGCGSVVESGPLAHSDTGGVVRVHGPRCRDCDEPMHPIPGRLVGGYVIDGEGPA